MSDSVDLSDALHQDVTRECSPDAFEAGQQRIEAGLDWAVGALATDGDRDLILKLRD